MATLGDLKSRIYEEIHQTRTTAVANAIISAVEFYKTTRFWCNEATRTFSLSATSMMALRTALPGVVAIDAMVAGTDKYKLEKKPWREIMELDDGNVSGDPYCYSMHHEQLRFYPPLASGSITIEAIYVKAVSLSASPSHSSIWTNELEPLIRARAKAVVYADFFLDVQKAQMFHQIEGLYLRQLLDRTAEESAEGEVERYL